MGTPSAPLCIIILPDKRLRKERLEFALFQTLNQDTRRLFAEDLAFSMKQQKLADLNPQTFLDFGRREVPKFELLIRFCTRIVFLRLRHISKSGVLVNGTVVTDRDTSKSCLTAILVRCLLGVQIKLREHFLKQVPRWFTKTYQLAKSFELRNLALSFIDMSKPQELPWSKASHKENNTHYRLLAVLGKQDKIDRLAKRDKSHRIHQTIELLNLGTYLRLHKLKSQEVIIDVQQANVALAIREK